MERQLDVITAFTFSMLHENMFVLKLLSAYNPGENLLELGLTIDFIFFRIWTFSTQFSYGWTFQKFRIFTILAIHQLH